MNGYFTEAGMMWESGWTSDAPRLDTDGIPTIANHGSNSSTGTKCVKSCRESRKLKIGFK